VQTKDGRLNQGNTNTVINLVEKEESVQQQNPHTELSPDALPEKEVNEALARQEMPERIEVMPQI